MFNSACCCASAMVGNSNSPTTKAAILDTDAPLLINTFNGPPSRDRGTQRWHPRRLAKKLADNGMPAYAFSEIRYLLIWRRSSSRLDRLEQCANSTRP